MTAPTLSFDIRGLIGAEQKLQLLALPAAKRRRLLNNASKRLRTRNNRRIQAQRNLDGSTFEKRRGPGKRKMLRGLGKRLSVTQLTADAAVLGWRQRRNARIADEHQTGVSTTMSAARMRREGNALNHADSATRHQARALLKAGYQIRQGKRWRRPTLGWIVENLKSGQAGLILAVLEGRTKHQTWKIDLPARDALGADPQDIREIVGTVLQQTLQSPK
ncbi:phage virion morphogenesis protein [Pseudomonas alvandae]|uniref:phage virion morphogenesis protein n=1 Tax=Pseudomonas TaxID=286 RepID=UPI00389A439A